MKSKRALVVLAVGLPVLVAITACDSESEPFESCDSPGGTVDVCEQGTVCSKPTDKSNAIVCIPICGDDKQCPKDYDCKGVEGTNIKGCRAKD